MHIRESRPSLYCIEIRTSKWEEMVQWYRMTLGLRVLVRVAEDGYALIEAGETRISILARENGGVVSPRWSLGFEVENLQKVMQRLEAASSSFIAPRLSEEGFSEIVTEDPDGNTVRVFSWPIR